MTKPRPLRATTAALGLVVAVVMALPSCSGDGSGGSSNAPSTARPSTSTTAPAEPVDQAAPTGTNGLAIDADGLLWVADVGGNQILAVDPGDGKILRRYGAEAGVEGPDDLAFDADGRLWWTSFTGGFVGRIDNPATPEAVSTKVAEVGSGANPIAVGPDGRVFVARALTGTGLYELDPDDDAEPRVIAADPGELNGFDGGPDGRIYAARPSTTADGGVVAIDPDTGAVEELAGGITLAVAATIGPDGDPFVLVATPAQVSRVDVASGTLVPYATPGTPLGDNLVFAPDGTLYVSAFDQPTISVIEPDGTVHTVSVGQA